MQPLALAPARQKKVPATLAPVQFSALPLACNVAPSQSRLPPSRAPSRRTSPAIVALSKETLPSACKRSAAISAFTCDPFKNRFLILAERRMIGSGIWQKTSARSRAKVAPSRSSPFVEPLFSSSPSIYAPQTCNPVSGRRPGVAAAKGEVAEEGCAQGDGFAGAIGDAFGQHKKLATARLQPFHQPLLGRPQRLEIRKRFHCPPPTRAISRSAWLASRAMAGSTGS